MAFSYVWHDSFICVTWLVHMCDMTHSYVTWRIQHVTWRIHMWHGLLTSKITPSRVTFLILSEQKVSMCVCGCVGMCVQGYSEVMSMCICACVYVCVCVCVCVCVREREMLMCVYVYAAHTCGGQLMSHMHTCHVTHVHESRYRMGSSAVISRTRTHAHILIHVRTRTHTHTHRYS